MSLRTLRSSRALGALFAISALGFARCSPKTNGAASSAPQPTDGNACTSNGDCGTGLCIEGTCGFSTCTCKTTPDSTLPGIVPGQTTCDGCPTSYRCESGRCYLPCTGEGSACPTGRSCGSACGQSCCPDGQCSPATNAAFCTLAVTFDAPDAAVEAGSTVTVRANIPSNPSLTVQWIDAPPNVTTNGATATIGPSTTSGLPLLAAAVVTGADDSTSAADAPLFTQARIGVGDLDVLYCLAAGVACDPTSTPTTGGCCSGTCVAPDGGVQTVCTP